MADLGTWRSVDGPCGELRSFGRTRLCLEVLVSDSVEAYRVAICEPSGTVYAEEKTRRQTLKSAEKFFEGACAAIASIYALDLGERLLLAADKELSEVEYRYEPHGTSAEQRATMERLGREGWTFVTFVAHWGHDDGKTLLFLRQKTVLLSKE